MAKKSSKAYFGFGRLLSIIFAIIPILRKSVKEN